MTEQKPTAPVKSEEKPFKITLNSLVYELACVKSNRDERLIPGASIDYYTAKITELEQIIRILETWPEVERVLGEYANEEHWYFDAGYNQYYPEDHNLRGNEPAQLILAKMEGEKK